MLEQGVESSKKEQEAKKMVNAEYIERFLMKIVDPSAPINARRRLFHDWRLFFYSEDAIHDFFSDTLFKQDGSTNYLDVMLRTDYTDFYQMAMALDLANMDPRAYYTYWILTYGNSDLSKKYLKEALEFDGDTIRGIFPDIEKVLFDD